ncbi:exported hypothetical protein [Candidatus Sulfopaludibacter sp. SbA4]|nr:exported hypothetical protein [Candidatus Sulfopaludibacter sp. SbA4]
MRRQKTSGQCCYANLLEILRRMRLESRKRLSAASGWAVTVLAIVCSVVHTTPTPNP